MNRKNTFIFLFAAAFFLANFSACSGTATLKAALEAASESSSGLNLQKNPLEKIETEKGIMLALYSSDIEKEFLIQTSFAIYDGQNIPLPVSLKSRIVRFNDEGDKLIMLDVTGGDQPSYEYSADKIVAEFPIVEKNSGKIVFDFNEGMQNFLAAPEWYASDSGTVPVYSNLIRTSSSLLKNVYFESGKTCIDQSLAAIYSFGGTNLSIAVSARYFISLYAPDKSYKQARTITPQQYLGYFETSPQVEPMFGTLYTKITRWHPEKQVLWALSENIPQEYRDAVKEGLLYWNKVFGREFIKVVEAPESVTAPSPSFNIVQWSNEYLTDIARADAQYDPRSGQILRAQIFIPESFVYGILADYDTIAIRNEKSANQIIPPQRNDIGGIQETGSKKLSAAVKTFSAKSLAVGKDIRKAMADDFLRLLIAHEIGHTLGLRHNFAASSDSLLTFAERERIFADYLQTGKIPENTKSPANSVMDYLPLEDWLILSQIIKKTALPYDVKAVNWGYGTAGVEPKYDSLNYCHDTNEGRFIDCYAFDSGGNPFDNLAGETAQLFEEIPEIILNRYIAAKIDTNPASKQEIAEVTPSALGLAFKVASSLFDGLLPLKIEFDVKSIIDTYANLNGQNRNEYSEDVGNWLTSKLDEAGGYDRIFGIIEPSYFFTTIENFKPRFNELLRSEKIKTLTRFDFTTTAFTNAELAIISKEAEGLFDMLPNVLVENINEAILQGRFERKINAEDIEAKIAKWAGFVLTDGAASKFTFNRSARASAAKLMNSGGALPQWLESYRPEITVKLREKLTALFGISPEEVNVANYERGEREWIENELSIYRSLLGGGGMIVPLRPAAEISDVESIQLPEGEDSIDLGGGMIHILRTLIP